LGKVLEEKGQKSPTNAGGRMKEELVRQLKNQGVLLGESKKGKWGKDIP